MSATIRTAHAFPRVDRLIVVCALAVGTALVGADVFQRWFSDDHIWALDIDGRFNAVTWFHSFVLAGTALAAAALACTYRERGQQLMWLVAGAAIAFLSLDKSISLHERVGQSVEERFGLAEHAGRLIWEVVYAPFLVALAMLLLVVVARSGARARLWVTVGVLLCATKVALEALMFPALHWGLFSEQSVVYGLEVNVEETVQLLGFAAFFGAFAGLLLDRVALMARGEIDAADGLSSRTEILKTPLPREWRKAV